MKNLIALFLLTLAITFATEAQNSQTLRAARMSFNSAENNYKRGNFQQAALEYEIVVNSIPPATTDRRYLEMRLESLIKLVDIYFSRSVNFGQACKNVELYLENMNQIRNAGTLKAADLLKYLRKEKEFETDHVSKCESIRNINRDTEEFKRKFEQEFE